MFAFAPHCRNYGATAALATCHFLVATMASDNIHPFWQATITALTQAGQAHAATEAELDAVKIELASLKLERTTTLQDLQRSLKVAANLEVNVESALSKQKLVESQRDTLTTVYTRQIQDLRVELSQAVEKV